MTRPLPVLALLFFVSLPGFHAAAEVEIAKGEGERGGWSEPVEGLRVRAVLGRKEIRLGEPVSLFVMIQNVSDEAITLPDFRVMPRAGLAEDDHPFGEHHQFNTMLICHPENGSMCILWAMQAEMQEAAMLRTYLNPHDVFLMVLEFDTNPAEIMKLAEAFELQEANVERHEVDLAAVSGPGRYGLRWVFDSEGLADEGADVIMSDVPRRLETPTVILTVRDPDEPAGALRQQIAD